jgi:glycosyltransferase involved in cell wall biosynthesis
MASGDHKTIDNISFPFKDYVLALPGWYPTWLDPLPGDFNQRHIKAASIYTPQVVLYIGKDQTGTLTKTETRINQPSERVLEFIVVYPERKIRALDVVNSNLSFFLLLLKYSSLIKRKFGKPLVLHSYIVMRGGLAGLILSKRWEVPFVLTENWTIYYPADPGYLPTRNKVFQNLVKRVFSNVKRFLPVTNDLREKAAKLLGKVPATIIPNVVETHIFNREHIMNSTGTFRFIHVSTMIYQKNPEGLLRTFKRFNEEHPETFLQLVGPYPPSVFEYATSIGLSKNNIEFTGAVSYTEVARLLKSSNALVLFSRYENLPCVILEAFCCGLPVISTRVGGIAEVINKSNGILIDSGNEEQLLEAFRNIYLNYDEYNAAEISEAAMSKFSYEAVGREINKVYEEVKENNIL